MSVGRSHSLEIPDGPVEVGELAPVHQSQVDRPTFVLLNHGLPIPLNGGRL